MMTYYCGEENLDEREPEPKIRGGKPRLNEGCSGALANDPAVAANAATAAI